MRFSLPGIMAAFRGDIFCFCPFGFRLKEALLRPPGVPRLGFKEETGFLFLEKLLAVEALEPPLRWLDLLRCFV